MTLNVTDSSLEETLKSKIVVLDFFASWCGPCRMLAPTMDVLASNNPDIVIGKIDVEANSESAIKYGIRNIPAVVIIKDGVEVDRILGNQPIEKYQAIIDSQK